MSTGSLVSYIGIPGIHKFLASSLDEHRFPGVLGITGIHKFLASIQVV